MGDLNALRPESPFPQMQPDLTGPPDEEGPAPRVNNPSKPIERGGRAYREPQQGPSGFPQLLPDAIGTSPDDQGFGVPPYGVEEPLEPVPDAVFLPGVEDEYIAQFAAQNKLLQQIYNALVGRGNPGSGIRELPLQPGDVIYRVERLILVNQTAAGTICNILVGTRLWRFAIPPFETRNLPFPLILQPGMEVEVQAGGETTTVYLVGYPGNDAGTSVGP